jgi:hypothetical protein
MIWFLEGPSSQRDVVAAARSTLHPEITVYASHSQNRPEITSVADIALTEPRSSQECARWALSEAQERGVQVALVTRGLHAFEALRPEYEKAGVQLVTGVTSVDDLAIDSKTVFTQRCESAGLAVAPAIEVDSAEALQAAYARLKSESDAGVCIKPVRGIYGAGFWLFDETADPFRCLAYPDSRIIRFESYLELYANSPNPQAQLVMTHLPGDEVSTDIVMHEGRAVTWVGRRKSDLYQEFEIDGPAVELAIAAAEHFKLDGLVSVQTKETAAGVPHLLEINLRYSGGIAYTGLSGINLAGAFSCVKLNLPLPPINYTKGIRVKPVTTAIAC